VLQHVAAACALEMTRVDAGFERERRSGAALLAEALQGRLDGRVLDSSLTERGINAPCVCIAIQAAQETVDRLERRWAINGVPHLLSGIGPSYIGILQADDAAIDGLADVLSSERYRVGVSDPFSGAGGLIDAARQARWALETVHQGTSGLARYGNDGDALLPRTLSEARLAAERILEPVLAYDREHGTELLRTLQTYLQCDRSPKQAAQLLFVHNQTVNYRISRIEELTGRSMRSTGDISELWFGLRALALSDSSEPTS
jgi:purine catabolism regulator